MAPALRTAAGWAATAPSHSRSDPGRRRQQVRQPPPVLSGQQQEDHVHEPDQHAGPQRRAESEILGPHRDRGQPDHQPGDREIPGASHGEPADEDAGHRDAHGGDAPLVHGHDQQRQQPDRQAFDRQGREQHQGLDREELEDQQREQHGRGGGAPVAPARQREQEGAEEDDRPDGHEQGQRGLRQQPPARQLSERPDESEVFGVHGLPEGHQHIPGAVRDDAGRVRGVRRPLRFGRPHAEAAVRPHRERRGLPGSGRFKREEQLFRNAEEAREQNEGNGECGTDHGHPSEPGRCGRSPEPGCGAKRMRPESRLKSMSLTDDDVG